jgi:hypothetical protein
MKDFEGKAVMEFQERDGTRCTQVHVPVVEDYCVLLAI